MSDRPQCAAHRACLLLLCHPHVVPLSLPRTGWANPGCRPRLPPVLRPGCSTRALALLCWYQGFSCLAPVLLCLHIVALPVTTAKGPLRHAFEVTASPRCSGRCVSVWYGQHDPVTPFVQVFKCCCRCTHALLVCFHPCLACLRLAGTGGRWCGPLPQHSLLVQLLGICTPLMPVMLPLVTPGVAVL